MSEQMISGHGGTGTAIPAPVLAPSAPSAAGGTFTDVIRRFTPNWFAATMGTGVLALVLNQFPLPIPGLHAVGTGLWLFNIALFVTFSVLYGARWVMFPAEARRIYTHSAASMFFGTIPMGLATIVNGFLAFGIGLIGDQAVAIATGLWWFDAALSLVIGVGVPYLMFTRQDHTMEKMTAIWLLPIVAAEVAAASGGLLAPHLAPAQGFQVLVLSYVLWAYSVPAAFSVLTVLLLRLVLHKLPGRDMAASGWLALGPIGTGAFGLIVLGGDAPAAFAAAGLGEVGRVAFGLGLVGGLMMWGFGVWWLALAVLKTLHYARSGMPFNLGWWGFTFPLGVYSLATLALARTTGLAFFQVFGAVLVVGLAAFWAVVAVRTLRGALSGALFISPCLIEAAIREQSDVV